jgi:hypothetical protein
MTRTYPTKSLAAAYPGPILGQRRVEAGVADLSVSSVHGVAALERFSSAIDLLNLAAARPNPFLSSAFLLCYALRIEYHTPGREEQLFLVLDGDRLIGCAPMRRSFDDFGFAMLPLRFRAVRLRFLAPLDTAQPGILCAPEDHERVATALIAYICARERGWGMLEFAGQKAGTTLHRVAHAAVGRRFRVRDIEAEPYNEISVVWRTLRAYYQSLAKKMRSNISRQARRLFTSGVPELILAEGAPAVSAWFDAYCDLDSRSWKRGTVSSINRHPRRVRFYREIAAGRGGLDPGFIGVVLDGVLVAGLIVGSNATASPQCHGAWCLEMAYDQTRADLGPGQLLLLLAVGEAIEKGHSYLSIMQNFAYYKRRWGAESIEVVNVQVIRRASLHNVRARLGEIKRRLLDKKVHRPPDAGATLERGRSARAESRQFDSSPDLDRARDLAATALSFSGTGVRRLDRGQSLAHLPFALE